MFVGVRSHIPCHALRDLAYQEPCILESSPAQGPFPRPPMSEPFLHSSRGSDLRTDFRSSLSLGMELEEGVAGRGTTILSQLLPFQYLAYQQYPYFLPVLLFFFFFLWLCKLKLQCGKVVVSQCCQHLIDHQLLCMLQNFWFYEATDTPTGFSISHGFTQIFLILIEFEKGE